MKIIEVSDDIYEFLMNISKELKTQDNRATASPYFYQIRETKEVPAHEGCGELVFYHPDFELELRSDIDKLNWIKDHVNSFFETSYEDLLTNINENIDTWTLNDMLETVGFEKFYVSTDYTYSNAFFTSKACDEHIRINKHNLKGPANFLSHAYRNEEMAMMFKFLLGLSETNNIDLCTKAWEDGAQINQIGCLSAQEWLKEQKLL